MDVKIRLSEESRRARVAAGQEPGPTEAVVEIDPAQVPEDLRAELAQAVDLDRGTLRRGQTVARGWIGSHYGDHETTLDDATPEAVYVYLRAQGPARAEIAARDAEQAARQAERAAREAVERAAREADEAERAVEKILGGGGNLDWWGHPTVWTGSRDTALDQSHPRYAACREAIRQRDCARGIAALGATIALVAAGYRWIEAAGGLDLIEQWTQGALSERDLRIALGELMAPPTEYHRAHAREDEREIEGRVTLTRAEWGREQGIRAGLAIRAADLGAPVPDVARERWHAEEDCEGRDQRILRVYWDLGLGEADPCVLIALD